MKDVRQRWRRRVRRAGRLAALGLVGGLGLAGVSSAQAWSPGWLVQLDATTRFEYEEPGVMREEGDLLGLAAAYTSAPGWGPGSWPLRFEGRLQAGETDYDGQLQSGQALVSETDDTLAELRLLTGAGPGPWHFYGGLGLRLWDQELADGQLKATGETVTGSGVERGHRYGYVPLGARLDRDLGSGWSGHLAAEYRTVFHGEVYFSSSGFEEMSLDMDDGDGWSLRAGIGYAATASVRLSAQLYLTRWEFDASERGLVVIGDSLYEVYEPANETEEAGIRLGVHW